MSFTRDAIGRLQTGIPVLRSGPALPKTPASTGILEILAAQDAPPAKPADEALAALRRNLQALAREGRGFDLVPPREMRHAPWLLWSQPEPLAALPGLLDEIVARAEHRRSVLRTLIEAWLQGYALGAAMVREAAVALRRLINAFGHPSMEAWRRADAQFRIFEVSTGPKTLAHQLLYGAEPVDQLLAEAGLDDPMRSICGYMRAVQDEVIKLAPGALQSQNSARACDRMFTFLAPDRRLRFDDPNAAGAMAQGLLVPWLTSSAVQTTEATRGAVERFLLDTLGDPRVKPARWTAAGEDAVALIRRWLTKASLDAFFGLIRSHALDHHWRYREAFWSAYLHAGAIDDAWLALAKVVHANARSIKELRGTFASLDGYGVDPQHSVLLMRIGNTIFCEWSHNGKIRAWPIDWKEAPRLTQATYSRSELVRQCLPFPPNQRGRGGDATGKGLTHASSSTGHWQESVAELIAQRTRLRLPRYDWMPK